MGAWAAPKVISVPSAGAQASPMSGGSCARVQWNFGLGPLNENLIDCINGFTAPDQADRGQCKWVNPGGGVLNPNACDLSAPNANGIHDSNSMTPNLNCCKYGLGRNGQDDLGTGLTDTLEWQSCLTVDFASTSCLTVRTSKGACPNPQLSPFGSSDWIEVSINQAACPDCYIADVFLTMADASSICTTANTFSTSSSEWFTSVRFNTSSGTPRYPIYLKLWVGCNLSFNDGSDAVKALCPDDQGLVPCTQCPKSGARVESI